MVSTSFSSNITNVVDGPDALDSSDPLIIPINLLYALLTSPAFHRYRLIQPCHGRDKVLYIGKSYARDCRHSSKVLTEATATMLMP
jgi:hypothetical protein